MTPTIAVVPRRRACPAGPGYGLSDDRFGLDILTISKSRTFGHRCHWIAQFRGATAQRVADATSILFWIFEWRRQHNGF